MPGFVGVPELLLLGLVVLLIFGPKRLPEMGRSMGRGMREFKDSVTGDSRPDPDEVKPELLAVASDSEIVDEQEGFVPEPVVVAVPRPRGEVA
jgi:sec-independent protein translocase protein TatA